LFSASISKPMFNTRQFNMAEKTYLHKKSLQKLVLPKCEFFYLVNISVLLKIEN